MKSAIWSLKLTVSAGLLKLFLFLTDSVSLSSHSSLFRCGYERKIDEMLEERSEY